MIIVPDTMVYLSGVTISPSYSSHVIQLWRNGVYDIAVSKPILKELARVFAYPKVIKVHGLTQAEVANYLQDISEAAVTVAGTTPVNISPDPKDNKFFACAVEAGAEYLVSKDRRHVLSVGSYKGVQTITPQDFIEKVVKLEKAA